MQFASEKHKVEAFLGSRPGVLGVEANPVSQTATVTFNSEVTTAATLRERVVECGYHCAGPLLQSTSASSKLARGRAPVTVVSQWLQVIRSTERRIGGEWPRPLSTIGAAVSFSMLIKNQKDVVRKECRMGRTHRSYRARHQRVRPTPRPALGLRPVPR